MASTRLSYPEDLGSGSTRDYIIFEFGDYEPPYKGGGVGGYSSTVTFSGKEKVYLNMPNDIGSTLGGNWAGKDLTGVAAFALGKVAAPVTNFVTGGTSGFMDTVKSIFDGKTITDAASAMGEDALRELGNRFSNLPGLGSNLSTNDILSLTSGTIINPNTELAYGGTGLRTHGYTFKLIPQSKTEAQNVIKIVEIFKKACAPKSQAVSVAGKNVKNFIGVPDIVKVSFMGDGGENPYLPRYKESALTSVSVNYITDGQYVSFREGEPIGISLTVSLTELKLLFSEEIGSGANQYR